jgi:hypothetical protein
MSGHSALTLSSLSTMATLNKLTAVFADFYLSSMHSLNFSLKLYLKNVMYLTLRNLICTPAFYSNL